MKKILALVLALAMVAMIGAVYAEDETPATPVNNLSFDTTISITGLDEGDTVTLYQLIDWGEFWKPVENYTGLSQTDVDNIVGQNHEDGSAITKVAVENYINQIVASTLPSPVDLGDAATVDSTGTFSYTVTSAGMYYALVAPKNGTKIYKPMFISSDFDNDNETITVAAKYETVEINKFATNQTDNQDTGANYKEKETEANSYNTVGIGDIVSFEIDTTIPLFPKSFKTPIFNISDTLDGLTLKHAANEIKVYAGEIAEANLLTDGTQYDLTATDEGFTVAFKSTYITGLSASQPIKVVYQGVVNNEAEYNVNAKENTATVNFSNNPNDAIGLNELKDETRHYTFSINGKVLYEGDHHGTDLIKVGIDANGNEITETVKLPNEHYAGVLEGATFTLYASDKSTVIRENLRSNATGQIEINGLDAGTYYLREESAPAGYIKSNTDAKIEIVPTFQKKVVPAEEKHVTIGGKDVVIIIPSYSYAELISYSIYINGTQEPTSTYTVTNDKISEIDDDQIAAGSSEGHPTNDTIGKIQNPKGTELPSTGGIGTTIFYILGGLLVVGAVVILVARRKAQD